MSLPVVALAASLSVANPAPLTLELTLKDHRFNPEKIEAPAGTRLELHVINLDTTSEEIESYALNREKVVRANGRIVLYLPPLPPGRYDLYGEEHPDSAQAVLEVR
jgi:hypothetical protein